MTALHYATAVLATSMTTLAISGVLPHAMSYIIGCLSLVTMFAAGFNLAMRKSVELLRGEVEMLRELRRR